MGEGPGGGWQTLARHGYPHLVIIFLVDAKHNFLFLKMLQWYQISLFLSSIVESWFSIWVFSELISTILNCNCNLFI
jgi:hypothetical protein